MATDYAEMEREFVAALAEDTGSDLAGWMAAISASGLSDRNAIIDWLRHQGFQFSRASWIERIHHNGGRLIYGDGETAPGSMADEPPRRVGRAEPAAAPPEPTTTVATTPELASALLAAKGLRPLAELVLREIRLAAPQTAFAVDGPLIFGALRLPFVALWPQPKKLRLYGDFEPGGRLDVRAGEAIVKAPPPFARMILLDDARRIDGTFRDLITAAAGRAGA